MNILLVNPNSDPEMTSLIQVAAERFDRSEVIILGCAGLTGLEPKLQAELDAPVLDGIACALFLAEGLIRDGSE